MMWNPAAMSIPIVFAGAIERRARHETASNSMHSAVKPLGSGVLVWLVLRGHSYFAYPNSP